MTEFRDPTFGVQVVTPATKHPDSMLLLMTPMGIRDQGIDVNYLPELASSPTGSDRFYQGVDDAVVDMPAMQTLLNQLQAQGYGTLWLEGTAAVDDELVFGNISFRARGRANVRVTHPNARLYWGPTDATTLATGVGFEYREQGAIAGSATGVACDSVTKNTSLLISENLTLDSGDWFMIWSSDEIGTTNALYTSASHRAAELHCIFRRMNCTVGCTPDDTTTSGTVTASVSPTNTINWTSHPITDGQLVRFSTTGTLPAGLSPGTNYYAKTITANTFQVSTTYDGTVVTISDTGSGTHTCYRPGDFLTELSSDGKTQSTANFSNGLGDMRNDYPVKFTSTGTLPAPLIAGTRYYVVGRDSTRNWKVAATKGGAAIDLTTAGSGTITVLSDAYEIGDVFLHSFTTSPKVRRVPMLSSGDAKNVTNLEVSHINFIQEANVSNHQLIEWSCINQGELHHCTWVQNGSRLGGPGRVYFHTCANIRYHNNQASVEDFNKPGTGSCYVCVFADMNGFEAYHNGSRRGRHAFDASNFSYDNGSDIAYGSCIACRVHHNYFCWETQNTGLTPLSSHANGNDISWESNVIVLASAQNTGAYAATIRGMRNRFINNHVYGAAELSSQGVLISAADCEVSHNFFDHVYRIAQIDYSDLTHSRAIIRNNIARDCGITGINTSGIILAYRGTDHIIDGNLLIRPKMTSIRLNKNCSHTRITNNQIYDMDAGGTAAAIVAAGTGTDSVEDLLIARNLLSNIPEICFDFQGGASGQGDNLRVLDNTFESCTGAALIKFADDGSTTGHRVDRNLATKGSNTNFVNTGSLASTAIKLRGNLADGYGSGSLGLTGTNATTINTNEQGFNWTST